VADAVVAQLQRLCDLDADLNKTFEICFTQLEKQTLVTEL
jgi:hypothetical protein